MGPEDFEKKLVVSKRANVRDGTRRRCQRADPKNVKGEWVEKVCDYGMACMSAALTKIARKLTASRAGEGKPKPTPTSDDACSESQDCQGNHKRCRAKVRKTLSSAQRTTDEYKSAHFSNKNKFHAYRNFSALGRLVEGKRFRGL